MSGNKGSGCLKGVFFGILAILALPVAVMFMLVGLTNGGIEQIYGFNVDVRSLQDSLKYTLSLRDEGKVVDWADFVTYYVVNNDSDNYNPEIIKRAYEEVIKGNSIITEDDKEIKDVYDRILDGLVGDFTKTKTSTEIQRKKEYRTVTKTVYERAEVPMERTNYQYGYTEVFINVYGMDIWIEKKQLAYFDEFKVKYEIHTEFKTVPKVIEIQEEYYVDVPVEKTTTESGFGIKSFYPLAAGFDVTHANDWGAARTYGGDRQHEGNDFMAAMGTPIVSIEDGVIEDIGWLELGGWRIGIRSKDKYRYSYYAHMDRYYPGMVKGKEVKAGDIIGYVGNTGYGPVGTRGKFAPHLHFQIKVTFPDNTEVWINPYPYTEFLKNDKVQVQLKDGEYYRVN